MNKHLEEIAAVVFDLDQIELGLGDHKAEKSVGVLHIKKALKDAYKAGETDTLDAMCEGLGWSHHELKSIFSYMKKFDRENLNKLVGYLRN